MEKNLDERMGEIAARIEETRRIRRGLYAHLGERIFNQVVADPDLRNGKEEILGAIAACNRELGRLEDASASLDARLFAERQVSDAVVEEAQRVVEAPAADVDQAAPEATDAAVVVAPLEPLSPATAPEPVRLEPVMPFVAPEVAAEMAAETVSGEASDDASDADAVAEVEPVRAEAADQDVEAPVNAWDAGAVAPDVADAADAADVVAAAPTIVLDRGGEAQAEAEPQEPEGAAGAAEGRTCPVCGAAVAPDHRFCMNCGYRLAD